jgi:hypothetical protein
MGITAELQARIDLAIAAILDAQELEHERRLGSRETRKLPADCVRILRRWRSVTDTAATAATVSHKSGARAPLSGQPEAGKQVNVCPLELSEVPAGEATSIRFPPPLRERAEEYGRERRWSFGEVVRVAVEELVDYEPQAERERSADGAA